MEFHIMDIGLALGSGSLKNQYMAALFLRSEHANGYIHLPMLLRRSQEIDLGKDALSKDEIRLISFGALAIGSILNAVGYLDTITMHNRLVDWLIELTTIKHIDIAAFGLLGLGELTAPPPRVVGLYEFVITSGLRKNEDSVVTLRSLAFRMLVKTENNLARKYIDHDACREYMRATEYWQVDCSQESKNALRKEIDWIQKGTPFSIRDQK